MYYLKQGVWFKQRKKWQNNSGVGHTKYGLSVLILLSAIKYGIVKFEGTNKDIN